MGIVAPERRQMLTRHLRSIRRPGVLAVGLQLGSYAPKVIGVLLLGRYLTTDQIGLYGILTAAVALLAVVLPFSGYVARSRPGVASSELSSRDALSIRLQTWAVLFVFGLASLPVAHDALEAVGKAKVPGEAYYLALITFVFSAFLVLGRTWIQSEFRHVSATVLGNLPDVLWIPIFVAFLAATSPGDRLNLTLLTRLIGTAAVTVYAMRHLPWRRVFRTHRRPGDLRAVTAFCMPLVLVSGSISVAGVLDRIILSRYASLTEVGKYTFMYLLFGMTATAAIVIHRVAGTRATAQANRGNWPAARQTLHWLALGLFALALVSGAVITAVGPLIHAVANKALLPSTATILATGLAFGFVGIRLAWQTWYQLEYRTRIVGILELLSAIAYVAFLFALTPPHRSLGAALAFVFGNAFGLVFYAIAWRWLGTGDARANEASTTA